MPATLKIEQKRFVDTVGAYYANSQAEEVNQAAKASSGGGGGGMTPPGGQPPNPTAKAFKSAQSRRTIYGNNTVSQQAIGNLNQPNNQRS